MKKRVLSMITVVSLSLMWGCEETPTGVVVTTTTPAGMKLIPSAGQSFTMDDGSNTQEVSFTRNFFMDSTEVTQKSYNDLMTATYTGYSAPSWSSTYGVGDNNPAYYVNWYDAVLYCNARSKDMGKDTVYTYDAITGTPGNDCELSNVAIDYTKSGFRLPTEAEWEYAARAGTTTDYYWGSETIDDYAWYSDNSSSTTHEVATKLPNAFGLYDMSGNVWEWCGDWHGTYSSSAVVDPTGATTGTYRVIRGGSWSINANFLRSGGRYHDDPGFEGSGIGFRVVCPQ